MVVVRSGAVLWTRLVPNPPLMRHLPLILVAAALAASCDSQPTDLPAPTEITVLVAYSSSVAAAVSDVEAVIRRGLDETNGVYSGSGVDARLVPVHFVEVAYEVTDRLETLGHLIGTADGVLDDLHSLRDRYAADVVLLVSGPPGTTINGCVMAVPENAFLIVQWEVLGAPGYGLAHEMGHLHGARHAAEDEPNPEPFPYGHAFRNESLRTVLAGGPQRKVPRFSGPDVTFEGVVLGDSSVRNVARVVRETAVYLSNFRGPQTPTPFVSPGTWPVLPAP